MTAEKIMLAAFGMAGFLAAGYALIMLRVIAEKLDEISVRLERKGF